MGKIRLGEFSWCKRDYVIFEFAEAVFKAIDRKSTIALVFYGLNRSVNYRDYFLGAHQ